MCTYFQDDNQHILMYNAIGILLCILRLCCSKLESGKYWNHISTYKVDFKKIIFDFFRPKHDIFTFQVIDHHFGTADLHAVMAATLVPMLLLCSIRNLKYLSPISMLANILQMLGLGLTFFYLLQELPATWERKAYANW